MELSDKVAALSAVAEGVAGDVLAIHVVLSALIETHPDRQRLADAMERHLSQQLSKLRDKAFDRGRAPGFAQAMTDDAEAAAKTWIRVARGG